MQMGIVIKVNFYKDKNMEKVFMNSLMVVNMKDNEKMMKKMVKVFIYLKIVRNMMVTEYKELCKVKENIDI